MRGNLMARVVGWYVPPYILLTRTTHVFIHRRAWSSGRRALVQLAWRVRFRSAVRLRSQGEITMR